jgi:putative membrane protein
VILIGSYLQSWQALPRPQLRLILLLVVAIVLANIWQPYPEIAPLQHVPTVLLILAAPQLLRRWPLSTRAIGFIATFFLLHTFAGRWTYSNVPYDAWAHALTGHTISATFGLARNDFDRVVHLSFGLLWTPAFAEAMQRYAGMGRRSSLWTAFLFVGAASALYEIFEWLLTIVVAPGMADDYNGQQGDPWDSQKDMAIAILGSAMSVLWSYVRRRA